MDHLKLVGEDLRLKRKILLECILSLKELEFVNEAKNALDINQAQIWLLEAIIDGRYVFEEESQKK